MECDEKDTLVVNLFGGPATGKSTLASDLFSRLKKQHILCELVLEYAKENIYEDRFRTLENQIYVFGKQHHRIWRVINKVDVIITDSPFLLSVIYDIDEKSALKNLVVSEFKRLNSINFLLERDGNFYDPKGRIQNEQEAIEKDTEIKNLLDEFQFDYEVIGWGEDRGDIVELEVNKHLAKSVDLYKLESVV